MTTKIYETEQKLKAVSKERQKSLIFRISGALREIMQFEHGTPVKVEVCLDDTTKYIKIYEKKRD